MSRLRYTALTDVGPNRKNNQDSGYASARMLVLADGMGGQAAGDLASAVVVQTVRRLDARPEGDVLEALAGAIHRANDRLNELVEEDTSRDGMGTTLIAMVLEEAGAGAPDRLGIAHVGDSRAYLLRDQALTQLTTDHTFVQSLVDEGRISEQEARTHPHRSLILRALQGGHNSDPDLFRLDVQDGDRILLCSDGLSDFVDVDMIGATLGAESVEMAADELVKLALEAPTTDNVTVVIAEIVPGSLGDVGDVDDTSVQPMLVGSVAEHPRPPAGGGAGAVPAPRSRDDEYPDEQDEEALRYAPRSYRRNPWLLRVLLLVVLLLAGGFGLNWAYDWTQSRYYVAESGDSVAIYRGIPQDVLGISLSDLYQDTDLMLSELPEYSEQEVSAGIQTDDLTAALDKVAQLEALARDCRAGGKAEELCSDTGPTDDETTPPTPDPTPTGDGPSTGPTNGGGGTGGGGGSGGTGGGGGGAGGGGAR